jgi:hypothetical protein
MERSFLENLRQRPRILACCEVQVSSSAGLFSAATHDVSARGCRLISPRPLAVGEGVRLALRHAGLTTHLRVAGRVTSSTGAAPWRLGIAFDAACDEAGARWFAQLRRFLGLPERQGLPELLPLSAMVYLGAPPLVPVALSREELALLSALREGTTVSDLLARFHALRPGVERALFSLLAQRYATLSRSEAVHPTVWRAFLSLQRGDPEVGAADAHPGPLAPAVTPPPVLPMMAPEGWARGGRGP